MAPGDGELVTAKVGVQGGDAAAQVSRMIDEVEARIRQAVPTARAIYLEPDIYRPQPAPPA